MQIIKASEEHVGQICYLLRQSITEACIADHHNDPAILVDWLKNKTMDNIRHWINSSKNWTVIACEEKSSAIGVGMISCEGDILLNYLLPSYIGLGIGKRILNELECYAKNQGLSELRVLSTHTAIPFYRRNGFIHAYKNDNDLNMIKFI